MRREPRPAPKRGFGDESGATAVEFALVGAAFITFVLGVFWTGWGLYCGADVRHAIERASRIYLSNPQTTDQQFEAQVGSDLIAANINDVAFTITKPTISGATVTQIAWTYDYAPPIPFVPALTLRMGSQITAPIRPG